MGGVLLKAQRTLNFYIFSMSTCYEHFSLCPWFSIALIFPVQHNGRFERIALRNSRKREAHKEVLPCIPSSIPTPSSPLLLLSPLFFPPLLPLPAQASPASSTSYDQTDKTACPHVLQSCKCGNQSKMHVSQRKERQPMQYRGTKTDRAKVQARKRKGNKLHSSKHAAGREIDRDENEVASRAAPSTASEKLHTGVPGPRLVAPPSS